MVNELVIRSALKSLMLFLTINYCLVKKESKYVKLKIIICLQDAASESKKQPKEYTLLLFFNEDFYDYGYSFIGYKILNIRINSYFAIFTFFSLIDHFIKSFSG